MSQVTDNPGENDTGEDRVPEHGATGGDLAPQSSDSETLTLHQFTTDYRHFSKFAARPLTGWPEEELGSALVSTQDLSALSEHMVRYDVETDGAPNDAEDGTRLWSAERYVRAPALSPDGALLACIVVEQERYPFALQIPLDDNGEPIPGEEREVKLPIKGGVRRVLYSPDGTWLACEVSPDGGDHEQIWFVTTDPDDPNAYMVDLANYKTVELVSWEDDYVAVSAYDHDGTVEGRLFDPVTGETRVVDRRTGGALVHSRNEKSLFRVGSRGNRELLVVDSDGAWKPLMPVDNGSTTDHGYVIPSDKEPHVIVRSDHSAARFRLLQLYPNEHGYRMEVLLERDDADLEEFTVSSDGSTIAVLWNNEGWCDLEIVSLTDEGARVIAVPELPSLIATDPSLTSDGQLLAVTVSGPEFPPRVVLYDVAAGSWVGDKFQVATAALSSNAEEGEDAVTMLDNRPRDERGRPVLSVWQRTDIVPELHNYTTRDGMRLSGWLYRAVGRGRDEPAPMVVYFHGGPEGQSRPDYNNVLRKLAASGYSVFQPNVRGSSGRGRWFSQADDRYGRFAAIDDAEDTLDYLIEAGLTEEGRAIIMGRSYGGYLVHASMTRHRGRWAGGIAACGMTDLETFYRDTNPWIAAAAQPKYGDPNLDKHLLEQASPLHQMSKVTVPVLFIHGELDSNVPISEAYQGMGVLTAHGVPTELLLFKDEGHEFERLPNRYEMAQRVLAFCERIFHE